MLWSRLLLLLAWHVWPERTCTTYLLALTDFDLSNCKVEDRKFSSLLWLGDGQWIHSERTLLCLFSTQYILKSPDS